ncbi:2OG-Fe(II) oxygenase [bacterium]|nr:2OG-Fe(II) oxygenase [bacterium]
MREVAVGNYRILTPFTSPWPFSVVDNFLSESLYNNLLSIMLKDQHYKPVDYSDGLAGVNTIFTPEKYKYTKQSFLLTPDSNILKKVSEDVARHLEDILPSKYFVIPDIVRCDPGYYYQPHKDHHQKTISIVVYLDPDNGDGTVLTGEKEDVVVKWKRNRAVVFENNKHGLHWYKNSTDKYRYTLNVYITTDGYIPFYISEKTDS